MVDDAGAASTGAGAGAGVATAAACCACCSAFVCAVSFALSVCTAVFVAVTSLARFSSSTRRVATSASSATRVASAAFSFVSLDAFSRVTRCSDASWTQEEHRRRRRDSADEVSVEGQDRTAQPAMHARLPRSGKERGRECSLLSFTVLSRPVAPTDGVAAGVRDPRVNRAALTPNVHSKRSDARG